MKHYCAEVDGSKVPVFTEGFVAKNFHCDKTAKRSSQSGGCQQNFFGDTHFVGFCSAFVGGVEYEGDEG